MAQITISSLIYRSSVYADLVWKSLQETTPMLKTGEAEFRFIANDPTPSLLKHLDSRKYPFVVQYNAMVKPKELELLGYGWPEYIHRLYRGYNRAILESNEIVVLINSDHIFSHGWLEGLLKYLAPDRILNPLLIEVNKFRGGDSIGMTPMFGGPNNFNFEKFYAFAEKTKRERTVNKLRGKRVYMPCMFHKNIALQVGLYPEGNICEKGNYEKVIRTGDVEFFRKLGQLGISHVTSYESIAYHFRQGEVRSLDE